MICTANNCRSGKLDCTRAACGFHLLTEEADAPPFEPHEPATWAEIALHVLVASIALFCLIALIVNVARAVI